VRIFWVYGDFSAILYMFAARCKVQCISPFLQFLHLVANTDWNLCDVPSSSDRDCWSHVSASPSGQCPPLLLHFHDVTIPPFMTSPPPWRPPLSRILCGDRITSVTVLVAILCPGFSIFVFGASWEALNDSTGLETWIILRLMVSTGSELRVFRSLLANDLSLLTINLCFTFDQLLLSGMQLCTGVCLDSV